MKTSFGSLLEKFDYNLPPELIAQEPTHPRDSARLLVYSRKTKSIEYDTFRNIGKYLPKNSVLVLNRTKVIPARLNVYKETGGRVEILFISRERDKLKVIADRKLGIQNRVFLTPKIYFNVVGQQENLYLLEPSFPEGKFISVMEKYGYTPLPPYIKQSKLNEPQRRKEYQTVFAKAGESVAAPTASLHFTKSLLASLKKNGIDLAYVELTVGLGTFASLREEHVAEKKLHAEHYKITTAVAKFLNMAKAQGRPIVAVGTTVVRTLESAAANGMLKNLSGDTTLFITEDYPLQFVDALITNFHVPRSSLLMLVSSLVGRKELMRMYKAAIGEHMRFYSFGDAMLIL